jgi:tetratricopeptide (TPR) repeat protein
MDNERLEFITRMHEKNPKDSFLAFAAAVELQMAGNRARAISICENIIENDPQFIEAYSKLGKFYENQNQRKKAISAYKKGLAIAQKNQNQKFIGELSEALMFLGHDDMAW